MKLDSGSHPKLYKLGMALYNVNPKLWQYGVQMVQAPSNVSNDIKFALSDKRFSKTISNVNLEVSILCNLRCTMCWWWGENGIGFKLVKARDPMVSQEMTKEQIFSVIDQMAPMGRPSLYISGGEPFIRGDTLDVIEYATSKGIAVITNDNGTLLNDDQLERLAKIKTLTINFSIDGPQDVHDRIRGKGTFRKTTETIRKLIELRKGSQFPSVKTNTTFSPWIVGRVGELIRYLQDDVNVDATRLQHLWFTDKEHAEMHKQALHRIFGTNEGEGVDSHVISTPSPEYIEKLAEEIGQIKATKYKKPVFIYPGMNTKDIITYYQKLDFARERNCRVAWNTLHIKANGDAMFCPDEWMTDFKLGNVKTEKLAELWNNQQAQKFRIALDKYGQFPACARCCVLNNDAYAVRKLVEIKAATQ